MTRVAVVDFGMGNLFSVLQSCLRAGLDPVVLEKPEGLHRTSGVILPGVGAFGDAMATLEKNGWVNALQDWVRAGKPLMGICLGLQLLADASLEFGHHDGLGLVRGRVVRLRSDQNAGKPAKVPHVGWAPLEEFERRPWEGTPLEDVKKGSCMYFVHSYHLEPEKPEAVLTLSSYGGQRFVSTLRQGSIFACQYHPERSGPDGLRIYNAFARRLVQSTKEGIDHVR